MKTPIAVLLISCWAMDARQAAAAEPARKLGTVKVKQLDEISGIAASRQNPFVFWLHNDGDDGRLFAVRANGKLAGVIDMPTEVEDEVSFTVCIRVPSHWSRDMGLVHSATSPALWPKLAKFP
jgi:hypothetical protein